MDACIHIQKVLDHIEENLAQPMDIALLAHIAGYSPYHFLRCFQKLVHLTPAAYIRKRRITEIVRRLSPDGSSIAALAFAYGFNSKENFVRAFKKEHHILPSEFRAAQNSLKLYHRLTLAEPDLILQPELVTLQPAALVVYACDEPQPPHFWNRYNAGNWSKRLSGGAVVADYGVSVWNAERKRLDYFIGIRADQARGDCSGTLRLTIPGGLYAVFQTPPATQDHFVNTIHRTWRGIGTAWTPPAGFRRAGSMEFEVYTEESHTYSETIYIPLEKMEEHHEAAFADV